MPHAKVLKSFSSNSQACPCQPSRALCFWCKFWAGRVRAEQGAAGERFPRPEWSLRNICDQAGWMPAESSSVLFSWRHALCRNAGPAAGALSGAITSDKDGKFRECTENSNEGSHQMWEKAYFSSRTERKQAVKKSEWCKLFEEKGGSQSWHCCCLRYCTSL